MAYELAPGWSNAKRQSREDWWSSPWFTMFMQDDSGWIHHLSMDGPTRCRPAGVESGSGLKQLDGPGRMRESIPSCTPRFPVLALFLRKVQRADIFYRYPTIDG